MVHLLERLVKNQDVPADYMYYSLPSPWMQIKCMRILQQFPIADDPSLAGALAEVLQRVVSVRSHANAAVTARAHWAHRLAAMR